MVRTDPFTFMTRLVSEGSVDGGPNSQWTHQVRTALVGFSFLVVAVAFLYVAAYVTLVKRRERVFRAEEGYLNAVGPCYVVDPSIRSGGIEQPAVMIHLVTLEAPQFPIASNWFRPIHSFDRTKVRTKHWQTYAILKVNGVTETNFSPFIFEGPVSTNYAIFLPKSSFKK